jgi:hypothetical protein
MHKTVLPALFLLALFAFEAVVVWRPFDSRRIAWYSGSHQRKSAGQMVRGFRLTQIVPGNLFQADLPRQPITHWHKASARLYTGQPNCFAIRFADYARANTGHVVVDWQQGDRREQWQVDASRLRNAFKDFCPTSGLDAALPFGLEIRGIDSVNGSAATLWLAKSKLPPAVVNGKPIGDRGLVVQLSYLHHMGPLQILRLDRGAFAFTCACSLVIGMLVLAAVRRRHADDATDDPLTGQSPQ